MSRRPLRACVVATASAVTLAAACASFKSGAVEGPQDGGAEDGSAGVDANAPLCPSTSPSTLCADFSGDPATGWTAASGDGGTIALDTTNFLSPPAAARFTASDVSAGESPIRVLQKSFPDATAAKVHVELGVRVNSATAGGLQGPKIFRIIFRDQNKRDRYEAGLFWGVGSAGITFIQEIRDANQQQLDAGQPAAIAVGSTMSGEWHRFTLDVALSGDPQTPGTGAFAFDGHPVLFTPPAEIQAFRASPSFSVGLEYSIAAQALLDYDLDDVVIDVR